MYGPFFRWKDEIRIVYGASRAAIYDLGTGYIFSLNATARNIVELVGQGQTIQSFDPQDIQFLEQLAALEIGSFCDSPQPAPDATHELPPPVPLRFLWLELTESCNLRCSFCYSDAAPTEAAGTRADMIIPLEARSATHQNGSAAPFRGKRKMTEADWKRVIRQAAAEGCRQLQFIGGEPLIYRPLLSLIDEARAVGFSTIEIFTNGTLLTDEMARALAEREVQVAISLHGSRPEIHDQITQQPGAFAKVHDNLLMLKRHYVPIRLAAVMMEQNQDDFEQLTAFAQDLGAEDFYYDIVRPVGRGVQGGSQPTKEALLRPKWLLSPSFFTSQESYFRNRWWHPCWAAELAVTHTGNVLPCVYSRDHVIGNMLDSSLGDVLASDRLKALWGLTKDKIEVCRDCEYRYACDDCRPLAEGTTGDLHSKYPRCTYNPYQGVWHGLAETDSVATPPQEDLPTYNLITIPESTDKPDQVIMSNRPYCSPHGIGRESRKLTADQTDALHITS